MTPINHPVPIVSFKGIFGFDSDADLQTLFVLSPEVTRCEPSAKLWKAFLTQRPAEARASAVGAGKDDSPKGSKIGLVNGFGL